MIRRLNALGSSFHDAQSQQRPSQKQLSANSIKNSSKSKVVKGHNDNDIVVCVQFMQFPVIFLRPTREESMETKPSMGSKVNTLNSCFKNEKPVLRDENNSILFNVCHRAEFEIEGNDLNNFFPPPCECYLLNSRNVTIAHWSCPCPLITLRQDSRSSNAEEIHNGYDNNNNSNSNMKGKIENKHSCNNKNWTAEKLNRPIYANYAMRQVKNNNSNNNSSNFIDGNTIVNDNCVINHRLKKFNSQRAFIGYAEMACRVVVIGYAQVRRSVTPYKVNDCNKKSGNNAIGTNTINQYKNYAESARTLTWKEQIEKPYVIRVLIDGKESANREMQNRCRKNTIIVDKRGIEKADCNNQNSTRKEICSIELTKQNEQSLLTSHSNEKERSEKHRERDYNKYSNHSRKQIDKQVQRQSNSVICSSDIPVNTLHYIIQYNVIYQLKSVWQLVARTISEHRVLPSLLCASKEIEVLCKLIDRHMKEIIRLTNIVVQEFNSHNWSKEIRVTHVNSNSFYHANVEEEYLKLTLNKGERPDKNVSLFTDNEQENVKVNKKEEIEEQISDRPYLNGINTQQVKHHTSFISVEIDSSDNKERADTFTNISEKESYTTSKTRKNVEGEQSKQRLTSQLLIAEVESELLPIVAFLRYSIQYQLESTLDILQMFVTNSDKTLLLEIEQLPTKLVMFTSRLERECQQFVMRINILFQLIVNKHEVKRADEYAIRKTEKKLIQGQDKTSTPLLVPPTELKKDSSKVLQQKVAVDKKSKSHDKFETKQSKPLIPTHSELSLPVYTEKENDYYQNEDVIRQEDGKNEAHTYEPLNRDEQSKFQQMRRFSPDVSISSVLTEPTINEETELLLSSSSSLTLSETSSSTSTSKTEMSTSSRSVALERSTDTKTAYDTNSFESESESESESDSSSDSDNVNQNNGNRDDTNKREVNTVSQNAAPSLLTPHLSTVPLSLPIPTLPAPFNTSR